MSIKAEKSFSLKDQLFNAGSVGELAARLELVHAGFQRKKFEQEVLRRFPQLELKERMTWIVTVLEAHLPKDFIASQEILLRALPEPLDPAKTDDDFGRFIWMVPADYVAKHGCTAEHLAVSLNFLREATQRGSAEGAIRPFLQKFCAETMAFVRVCAEDENYHVRRLASEGIRPLLPWAPRAHVPLNEIITVLDRLHTDSTRYVTRSVCNNLNDIAKIDPDRVITTLKRWRKQKRQQAAELSWMTRHALRTLLKEDHPSALELIGYPLTPRFRLSQIRSTDRVQVGESYVWEGRLISLAEQRLKITLRLGFLKANGKHSAKVFAVKDVSMKKGEELAISKQLPFKPITTRVLYPGTHTAELIVNGIIRGQQEFELVA